MFDSEQNSGVTSPLHAALGVDVGTTNTKVALVSVHDDGTVREERILALATPTSGAALREAVLGALRTVAADAQVPVQAIGIASMAETGALIDADGEPLGELLRWQPDDARRMTADALVASAGAEPLYAATGVPVVAKSPLVQWLTLAAAGDARLGSARWAGAADLIALALTGEHVTDRTLAARTMAYRLDGEPDRGFDPDLLALAGIVPERFPRIPADDDAPATLTRASADALGLLPGIPVVVAGHDHAVGAWAVGARRPGDAVDSVGTAEALYRVAAHVPREPARRAGFSIGPTVGGMHESLLGGNPTAGAFVEWAFRELLPGADRAGASRVAAAVAAAGPSTVVVLPYLRGRQAPAPDPRAIPRVVDLCGRGAGLPTDPGESLAAILTGLTLQLAWLDAEQTAILEELRSDALCVIGGAGATDPAWWSLKRLLLPGSLRRVASAEPVATGAGMLALCRAAGVESVLDAARDDDAPDDRAPDRAPNREPVRASGSWDPRNLLAAFVAAATTEREGPE